MTKKDCTSKDNINMVENLNRNSNMNLSKMSYPSIQRNDTFQSIQKSSATNLTNAKTIEQFKKKTSFPSVSKILCFFFDSKVCKVCGKVKKFNIKFSRIAMLFDVIYYLKEKNDISLLLKRTFSDKPINKTTIQYQFELPSLMEQEQFNFYMSMKKN